MPAYSPPRRASRRPTASVYVMPRLRGSRHIAGRPGLAGVPRAWGRLGGPLEAPQLVISEERQQPAEDVTQLLAIGDQIDLPVLEQELGPLEPFGQWLLDRLRDHSRARSEEHTSELQSRGHLVCRLLLEKKKRDKDSSVRDKTAAESRFS